MESFIQKVAKALFNEQLNDYSNYCVVFPTRRACNAFRKAFAYHLAQPVWGPEVLSINDLIEQWEDVNIADDLQLLFELYQCILKYEPNLEFEKFYTRGKILLSDFEEIDKNLVDANTLFKNLYDLKEIDSFFYEDEEQSEAIKSFWKSFSTDNPTELQNRFLEFWKIIPNLYNDFIEALKSKNITTSGKCYRNIAEKAKQKSLEPKFDQYIFAGFYAFLDTEKLITDFLVKQHNAQLYWDTDAYYVDDEVQEAGEKIRKQKLKNYNWKFDYFNSTKKEIKITSVAHSRAQASYVGHLIQQYQQSQDININKTAVVLCDEHMLMPLLYSLPEKTSDANITMGYALGKSLAYDFLYLLYNVYKDFIKSDGGSLFYKNVIPLLRLPIINLFAEDAINEKINYLENKNITHISAGSIGRNDGLHQICFLTEFPKEVDNFWTYLETAINRCIAYHTEANKLSSHEIILLKSLKPLFSQFKQSILSGLAVSVSTENIWKLFLQQIKSTRIPFDSGKQDALQIMGFLETRVLDFDHLIILSANEGNLPAPSKAQSFIPYSLRKGYKLPTFEDHDSIYAYHFYRLLQRAKTVELVYTANLDEMGQGEPSRYILQLEYELKHSLPNVKLSHQLVDSELHAPASRIISVEKTPEIIQKLINKYSVKNKKQKGLSATAFSTYNSCPLRFYFSYILNIREPEEITEDLDAGTFGTVFHESMNALYTGVDFNQKALTRQLGKIEATVDEQIKKEIKQEANDLQGKNILLREVIINLIDKVIKNDIAALPITILANEKKYRKEITLKNGDKILLEGIIDRIDEHQGKTRIIDYKTGSAKALGAKSALGDVFLKNDLKASLQLFFYAHLLEDSKINDQTQLGIYQLKKVNQGVQLLKRNSIPDDLAAFKSMLMEKLNELFNTEMKFHQTDEIERCVYCPYKTICGR